MTNPIEELMQVIDQMPPETTTIDCVNLLLRYLNSSLRLPTSVATLKEALPQHYDLQSLPQRMQQPWESLAPLDKALVALVCYLQLPQPKVANNNKEVTKWNN
jgi:hypothetical protein